MSTVRQRAIHYNVFVLPDGTVLSAFPVRKPSPVVLKRDRLRIDSDGVTREYSIPGKELSDVHNENRTRLQDVVATRLNTRRALRELVLPELKAMQNDIRSLRTQLDRIEELLRST